MKTSILSLLPIPGAAREFGRRSASLVLVALAALAGPGVTSSNGASASPPDTMTYQGFLVDANGNALAPTTPQNYPVVFRIYAVASGAGSPLWSEQQIVTVDKGNFSVMLGEGTPVGGEPRPVLSSVFAGATASDRYIGISVTIGGATTEILPRLRLVPSPYAFLATSANNLVQPNGSPFLSYDGGQVNVSGNLGIGTVAAGRRLQIGDVNTGNSEGMIRLASRSGTGGASRVWDFGVPETDQDTIGIGYSFVIDDVFRAGTEFMVQFGTGNVGIGTATPNAPLSFGNSLANTKLALWDGGPGTMYGFGVQAGQFRMHVNNPSDRFSFLNGPAGSEVMRIQGNGNVGIGTGNAALTSLLQLGSVGLTGDAYLRIESIGGNLFANGLKLRNFNDEHGFDLVNQERNGTGLQANGFHIVRHYADAAGATALFIDKFSGNVGLGTTAPLVPLTVQHGSDPRVRLQLPNGSYADFGRNSGGVGSGGALYLQLNNNQFGAGNRSVVYNGDSNWDFFSDRRLKKDIADAESMLDRALRVQVRRFRWKDDPAESKHQLGVIAQEVQPLFPDLVGEFEDPGTKEKSFTVGYGDFAIISLKALQELKAEKDSERATMEREIRELKQEVEGLRTRLSRTARVDALEQQVDELKQLVQRLASARKDQEAAVGAER